MAKLPAWLWQNMLRSRDGETLQKIRAQNLVFLWISNELILPAKPHTWGWISNISDWNGRNMIKSKKTLKVISFVGRYFIEGMFSLESSYVQPLSFVPNLVCRQWIWPDLTPAPTTSWDNNEILGLMFNTKHWYCWGNCFWLPNLTQWRWRENNKWGNEEYCCEDQPI